MSDKELLDLLDRVLTLPVSESANTALRSYREQAEAGQLDPDNRKYVIAFCDRLLHHKAGSQRSDEQPEIRMQSDQRVLSGVQTASVTYTGIGFIFGVGAGIVTFIAAWAYCVITYGFVLGLGLGWFPAAICAGIVGWATVFLWGAALLIILVIGGVALISAAPGLNSSFIVHALGGAAVGWLMWRLAPRWISFRIPKGRK